MTDVFGGDFEFEEGEERGYQNYVFFTEMMGRDTLDREAWRDSKERQRQFDIEIRLECLEAKAKGRGSWYGGSC